MKAVAVDVVREIMKETGYTNGKLGNAISRNADVVNKRLNQKELGAGVLAEMVAAMGYKVVVMKNDAKVPEDAYEVAPGRIGKAGGPK